MSFMRNASVILASCLLLAGCSSTPAQPSADCAKIAAQASHEAMSELAEAGLVADPVALRAAVPDAIVQDSHDPIVLLPSYEALQTDRDVSDAERAELMSALTSEMVGVGTSFDSDAFLARLNAYGPCAGAVIPK